EFSETFKRTFDLGRFRGTIRSEGWVNTTDCADPVYVIDNGSIDESQGQGGGGGGGSAPPTREITVPTNPYPEPNDIVIVFFPTYYPEDDWEEVSQTPRYFRLIVGLEEPESVNDCLKEVFGVLHPISECSREFLLSTTSEER